MLSFFGEPHQLTEVFGPPLPHGLRSLTPRDQTTHHYAGRNSVRTRNRDDCGLVAVSVLAAVLPSLGPSMRVDHRRLIAVAMAPSLVIDLDRDSDVAEDVDDCSL
jgi:hypothetical protein